MRVLILGAGGIGGYFGARLIEAGHDVEFLVRPARAASLAQRGLRVLSDRGNFAAPVRAIPSIDADTQHDLVILSCKAYDLDGAIASIAPAVKGTTRVLPLLNGLRHLDALDAAFGAPNVLGGLCHISVTLEDDGSIRQFGALERLTFGTRDAAHPVLADIVAGLLALGPTAVASEHVLAAMWEKFAFIASLAGPTCLLRGAVGEIVATAGGDAFIRRYYGECAAVASHGGFAIPDAAQSAALAILTAPKSPLKASMLRDLERGARTECEHILGDLRARAATFDIDAPLLDAALTHLRVYEASRGAAAA